MKDPLHGRVEYFEPPGDLKINEYGPYVQRESEWKRLSPKNLRQRQSKLLKLITVHKDIGKSSNVTKNKWTCSNARAGFVRNVNDVYVPRSAPLTPMEC